jgi:hypothetical protein
MKFTDARDRRGVRAWDANAGHPGEIWPGVPPRVGSRIGEALDQSKNRIELTDLDGGRLGFEAEVFLPPSYSKSGYGTMPPSPRAGDAALLGRLCEPDPFQDCARLGALQRLHNAHYRR